MSPLADVIAEIREQHRFRQDYHSAEKRLTNQVKAIERRMAGAGQRSADSLLASADAGDEGGDEAFQPSAPLRQTPVPALPAVDRKAAAAPVTVHLVEVRTFIASHRRVHERRMAQLAQQLPVWTNWAAAIRGIGPLGLAQLVGECGDIGTYANPAKLWKRMGVAVIRGERQRRVAGELALEHGYSPTRRSILYNLGEALIKQNQDGPYRTLYLLRKELEATKPPCGRVTETYTCKSEDGTTCSAGHIHARARRYMEKRFLVDLWKAWRRGGRAEAAA